MKEFKFQHKENIACSIEWLGFSRINVFEIIGETLDSIDENEILTRVLKSGLFSDHYLALKNIKVDFEYVPSRFHGAIDVEKIDCKDYKKLSYSNLLDKIKLFQQEDSWGADLPVFIDLFNQAKIEFERLGLLNRDFFCIINDLSENQCLDFNFYGYFINIIVLCKEKNEIVIIDFGAD